MNSAVMAPAFRVGRALLLAAVMAVGWGGCAGYQLGDAGTLPFRTVYVAPPVNTSLAPQVAALLGSAVGREIDRSRRATLAPAGGADAALVITITDYRREISAERTDDTGLARKWRVTLTAECTLTDQRAGRAWITRRPVSAFDEVYVDSGSVPAEYQNMPELARRLARAIAHEVLAVW